MALRIFDKLKFMTSMATGAGNGTAASAQSRNVARERLAIILAHQRGSQALAGVNMQLLQSDVLACIQRHISVAQGADVNIAGGQRA